MILQRMPSHQLLKTLVLLKNRLPFADKKYSLHNHVFKLLKSKNKQKNNKARFSKIKPKSPKREDPSQIRKLLHDYDPRLTKHENFIVKIDAKLKFDNLPKIKKKLAKKYEF
mmetsp:Transcript_3904/g.3270  ORF Transcript_3904/g.3270 Transcript_3904/m.3270 type:complete len:112 (-) Transcript_3904:395-730(-)